MKFLKILELQANDKFRSILIFEKSYKLIFNIKRIFSKEKRALNHFYDIYIVYYFVEYSRRENFFSFPKRDII
jgi:hypothetical protein